MKDIVKKFFQSTVDSIKKGDVKTIALCIMAVIAFIVLLCVVSKYFAYIALGGVFIAYLLYEYNKKVTYQQALLKDARNARIMELLEHTQDEFKLALYKHIDDFQMDDEIHRGVIEVYDNIATITFRTSTKGFKLNKNYSQKICEDIVRRVERYFIIRFECARNMAIKDCPHFIAFKYKTDKYGGIEFTFGVTLSVLLQLMQ